MRDTFLIYRSDKYKKNDMYSPILFVIFYLDIYFPKNSDFINKHAKNKIFNIFWMEKYMLF